MFGGDYMTNGDRIRAMTDEELCQWIDRQYDEDRLDWETLGCYKCINYNTHHYPNDCGECEWKFGILHWLKSEDKQNSEI